MRASLHSSCFIQVHLEAVLAKLLSSCETLSAMNAQAADMTTCGAVSGMCNVVGRQMTMPTKSLKLPIRATQSRHCIKPHNGLQPVPVVPMYLLAASFVRPLSIFDLHDWDLWPKYSSLPIPPQRMPQPLPASPL